MRTTRTAGTRAAMTGRLVPVTSSFPTGDDGSEAAGSFVADLARELARSTDVSVVATGRAAVTIFLIGLISERITALMYRCDA